MLMKFNPHDLYTIQSSIRLLSIRVIIPMSLQICHNNVRWVRCEVGMHLHVFPSLSLDKRVSTAHEKTVRFVSTIRCHFVCEFECLVRKILSCSMITQDTFARERTIHVWENKTDIFFRFLFSFRDVSLSYILVCTHCFPSIIPNAQILHNCRTRPNISYYSHCTSIVSVESELNTAS